MKAALPVYTTSAPKRNGTKWALRSRFPRETPLSSTASLLHSSEPAADVASAPWAGALALF